jgi:hypothetical protein
LEDRPSRPSRVWNRIPDAVRDQIVDLALGEPDLSPRELAVGEDLVHARADRDESAYCLTSAPVGQFRQIA